MVVWTWEKINEHSCRISCFILQNIVRTRIVLLQHLWLFLLVLFWTRSLKQLSLPVADLHLPPSSWHPLRKNKTVITVTQRKKSFLLLSTVLMQDIGKCKLQILHILRKTLAIFCFPSSSSSSSQNKSVLIPALWVLDGCYMGSAEIEVLSQNSVAVSKPHGPAVGGWKLMFRKICCGGWQSLLEGWSAWK